MTSSPKYPFPAFLDGVITPAAYARWLHRKAVAHVVRDRKRGNATATNKVYKQAIHRAVMLSKGLDAYTGEQLRWDLISTYDNAQSKEGKRLYKAGFALLPSVDHVDDGLGPADFVICGWRTNDAKNDLLLDEFVELCRRVVQHADATRSKRAG